MRRVKTVNQQFIMIIRINKTKRITQIKESKKL